MFFCFCKGGQSCLSSAAGSVSYPARVVNKISVSSLRFKCFTLNICIWKEKLERNCRTRNPRVWGFQAWVKHVCFFLIWMQGCTSSMMATFPQRERGGGLLLALPHQPLFNWVPEILWSCFDFYCKLEVFLEQSEKLSSYLAATGTAESCPKCSWLLLGCVSSVTRRQSS